MVDAFGVSTSQLNCRPRGGGCQCFITKEGGNLTPDKLPKIPREAVTRICDLALRRFTEVYKPEFVIGVGNFAEERAQEALGGLGLKIGRITHPSPANPKANRGWEALIEKELSAAGLMLSGVGA